MHQITIVALGPGSPDLLTLGALKQLKKKQAILLRTARHGAVKLLRQEGIAFDSLDALYDQAEDFDAFARQAVENIENLARQAALTYAVADPAHDETVRLLMERLPDQVQVLQGVSLSAPFETAAMAQGAMLVTSAMNLRSVNAQQPLCVVELNSKALAGDVKLKLLPVFGAEARVLFFPPSEAAIRSHLRMTLEDLDRQPRYNHTCGFVVFPVPLLDRGAFDPEDLLTIMRILRAPDGCPWDREQTHTTLAKYLVEEANEAACALLDENWEEAADELGDVFLQLAFHAVVGEEHATFTWQDMLRAICRKMIRRHPHIFGEVKADTSAQVLANWDEIKKAERGGKDPGDRMLDVHCGLPPMLRAEKVQKLAAKVGFDWDKAEEALDKVLEEAEELRRVIGDKPAALDELGDLLFSCINTARLMDISADQALHFSIEKFIKRFNWVENAIKRDQKHWNLLTSNEIGVYWERSKADVHSLYETQTKEEIT